MRQLISIVSIALSSTAMAGIDSIYAPTVEQGELEFEFKGNYVVDDNTNQDAYTNKFAIGYGVNAHWFVEGIIEMKKSPGDSAEIEAYELENRFQLSEPGQYAVDYGMLLEIEKVKEADIWEIKTGPLIAKDFNQWTAITNLLLERQLGTDKTEDEWEFIGRALLKYRYSQAFEPGIEYYGEEHLQALGIVAAGKAQLGTTPFKWISGLDFGLNEDTPDITYRWELELEF